MKVTEHVGSDWLSAAALGVCLLLIFGMFVYLNRRRPARPMPAPMSDDPERDLRELAADLSGRAKRLDGLITEADQRIEELKRLTGEASERPNSSDIHPRDSSTDSLTERVYALADRGRNPLQIAQELQEHVGKVELILALRGG